MERISNSAGKKNFYSPTRDYFFLPYPFSYFFSPKNHFLSILPTLLHYSTIQNIQPCLEAWDAVLVKVGEEPLLLSVHGVAGHQPDLQRTSGHLHTHTVSSMGYDIIYHHDKQSSPAFTNILNISKPVSRLNNERENVFLPQNFVDMRKNQNPSRICTPVKGQRIP